MVDRANFVKSTLLTAYTGSFTNIMKMCMKKLDAEKNFLDKLTGFLT